MVPHASSLSQVGHATVTPSPPASGAFRAAPPGTAMTVRIASGPDPPPGGRRPSKRSGVDFIARRDRERTAMRSDHSPAYTRRAVLAAGLSAAGALALVG